MLAYWLLKRNFIFTYQYTWFFKVGVMFLYNEHRYWHYSYNCYSLATKCLLSFLLKLYIFFHCETDFVVKFQKKILPPLFVIYLYEFKNSQHVSLLDILFLSTALERKRGDGMGFGHFYCMEEDLFIRLVHSLATE